MGQILLQQPADQRKQRIAFDRMTQRGTGPGLDRFRGSFHSVCRYRHNREVLAGGQSADVLYHRFSVHSGHLDVGDYEVRFVNLELLQAHNTVLRDDYIITLQLQKDGEYVTRLWRVFDD